MAVFTVIEKNDIENLLLNYKIGTIRSFEGILEGVENTNYKIQTSINKFVLTIFEKRIDKDDLPFFINLQKHLANKNVQCPIPVPNKKGVFIQNIKDKKCVIMSFLEGNNQIKNKNKDHCFEVGKLLGKLHQSTKDFNYKRQNYLNLQKLNEIILKCSKQKQDLYSDLIESIENEISFISNNYPKKLPRGIIHGDIFMDNVFFNNNKISGIIDFYFACIDYYIYDLSICINAWCFSKNGIFDNEKFKAILIGYETHRKINKEEKDNLNIILRLAAVRILVTRLHDLLFHKPDTYVTPKDPIEFYEILSFHKNNINII